MFHTPRFSDTAQLLQESAMLPRSINSTHSAANGVSHLVLCASPDCRGKGIKIPQPAITAAGAARTALKNGCKDVSVETVERHNLLKQYISMLPASSQAQHSSNILARRYVEYMDPAVMVQALSRVSDQCTHKCAKKGQIACIIKPAATLPSAMCIT